MFFQIVKIHTGRESSGKHRVTAKQEAIKLSMCSARAPGVRARAATYDPVAGFVWFDV